MNYNRCAHQGFKKVKKESTAEKCNERRIKETKFWGNKKKVRKTNCPIEFHD